MTPEQQAVGHSIEFLFDRSSAELMYFWAGVLLPFVTVGAIIYARAQVVEAKQNTAIIAKQAKATLLLILEEKWNSADMRAAKKCFVEKRIVLIQTFIQRIQISTIQLSRKRNVKNLKLYFVNYTEMSRLVHIQRS